MGSCLSLIEHSDRALWASLKLRLYLPMAVVQSLLPIIDVGFPAAEHAKWHRLLVS